jgi:DNA-binding NarL/FixJ family response regulator
MRSVASPITVVLVDPDVVARAGLRALLTGDRRFALVGEATGDGVSLAERLRPDLIVLDPQADERRLDLPLIVAFLHAVPTARLCIRSSVLTLRSFWM